MIIATPPSARPSRLRYARGTPGEYVAFVGLATLTVAGGFALIIRPEIVPVSVLVVPILAAGFFLAPASLRVIVSLAAAFLLVIAVTRGMERIDVIATGVLAFAALVARSLARSRARLGVHGTMGESLLVDLRDRLAVQSALPDLPRGWDVQSAQRLGGRTAFSGDFVVFAASNGGRQLETAIVDVSGKGYEAGARALQLSGAFGGLLGAVPPDEFLPAANAYLLRQNWPEGFATAVHVTIDLETGDYFVRSAGHPPAIGYHAGSGLWSTLESFGDLLGVMADAAYGSTYGTITPGDALLLYTDGVVEMPRRSFADGIDKLKGQAERLVVRSHGLRNGAETLIDAVAPGEADDRALVLIRRT